MVDMENRERPKPYIERAIKLLEATTQSPMILELGCCRQMFSHDVDNDFCPACCDGHSTYLWARTGWIVHSVDNNQNHIDTAKELCKGFLNVSIINMDAIVFARKIPIKQYDLIFLDAWDVDLPECAEKHLEFYSTVKDRINTKTIILIDDTDLYYDHENKEYFPDPECLSGKGKLLIPELLKDGYEILFKGRQTLLRKP